MKMKKIYVTASGGPFLKLKKNDFKKIKPKAALNHLSGKWDQKFQ